MVDVLFEIVFFVLFAAIVIRMLGVWGAALFGLVLGARWLFLPQAAQYADECAKCSHAYEDHHGNCQECLRATRRRDADAPAMPCSKFKRGEAPTPWKAFAARRTVRQ